MKAYTKGGAFLKYKIYIFDADATLLDYNVSEENAFIKTMLVCGVSFDKKLINEFNNICWKEWNKLNLDKTEDTYIQNNYHKLYYEYAENRFRRLKEIINIEYTASELSNIYLQNFAMEDTLIPYANEICMYLSKNSRLILATNGLSKVQNARINNLRGYFEKCFISEEIGYIKPSREFFEYMLQELRAFSKECLMIGDSISSDILGAHNVDIDTCWYNQNEKANKYGIKPTYEVKSLHEIIMLTS